MKKNQVLKRVLIACATVSLASAALLGVPLGMGLESSIVASAQTNGTSEIKTMAEFEKALKDINVTEIIIANNLTLTKSVLNIPNRDVTIRGANSSIVINAGTRYISGKTNTRGSNTVTVKDLKIIANDATGVFFSNSTCLGWDVIAEGVHYEGARFVKISQGKLTFQGTNVMKTRAENAWVHDLEFAPNSVYHGVAAKKDGNQYSAFYFNGSAIKCRVTGKVTIGENADVQVSVGPQSTRNYYYPVFYGKVTQVDVASRAKVKLDAAGTAFSFANRCDYLTGAPILNVHEGAELEITGRGGCNKPALELNAKAQVNVNRGASLKVNGHSKHYGAIKTPCKGVSINLNQARNFEVANSHPNAKLLYAKPTTINGTKMNRVEVWGQTGGDYPDTEINSRMQANNFSYSFGKCLDARKLATTGSLDADFDTAQYGKVRFVGSGF